MAGTEKEKKKAKHIKRIILDIFAAICWCYFIVKLAIFDFDTYLIGAYFPQLRVVLDYKLFFLMGATSVLWLALGRKRFPALVAYVLFFPVIIVFWKIPKLVFRDWSTAVILAPSVFSAITGLRTLFIRTTLAALAALCIFVSSNSVLLSISMTVLGAVLIIHLYCSFRKAYQSTVFRRLREILSRVRSKFATDSFWKGIFDQFEREPASGTDEDKLYQKLTSLYAVHGRPARDASRGNSR